MSPFYTLVNKSSYELEVGEVTSQVSTKWHYISSTEVRIISVQSESAPAYCWWSQRLISVKAAVVQILVLNMIQLW